MHEAKGAQAFVPDSGRGAGVLVLAAGSGSGVALREAGMRLARHGFVALGLELPAPCEGAPGDAERRAVDAGIERLFSEAATQGARIGVVGFGRGGLLALDAAARGARVAVVVALDADLGPRDVDGSLARVDGFVLAVFAEKGTAVARGDIAELERRLAGDEIACELRILPGVGEGFADPAQADRYDAVAARAGWDAAIARLRAEL